ncbi:MAG TPA: FAD-binding protein, partial [Chthoniobacteraceae bacterium]|nr:FAD-binding protein [Chthoniobacteraceae bacterium]
GTDADLIDMTALNQITSLDSQRGILEAGAGATWPGVIDYCWRAQEGDARPWGIVQKQTGADVLTLGGGLASNVHGRGLCMRPIVQDVESFTLVTPSGEVVECNRSNNVDLFRLVIGGYGLFGVVAGVKLRLAPRIRLRRIVKEVGVDELMAAFGQRIASGCTHGDWQYVVDPRSPDFLTKGILACYQPVEDRDGRARNTHHELSAMQWEELYRLAFTDKAAAYKAYSEYYLATDGQLYWSDTHQLTTYLDDYHGILSRDPGFRNPASLMITELYVPRENLAAFMRDAQKTALKEGFDVIYGTVRLIEKDGESFLPWAKEPYACVIFNLLVEHSPAGIEKAKREFRALIDAALHYGGSYYLTYHRWARKDQVQACYPQFGEFLQAKARHDPAGLIRSDWYSHYWQMLGA